MIPEKWSFRIFGKDHAQNKVYSGEREFRVGLAGLVLRFVEYLEADREEVADFREKPVIRIRRRIAVRKDGGESLGKPWLNS